MRKGYLTISFENDIPVVASDVSGSQSKMSMAVKIVQLINSLHTGCMLWKIILDFTLTFPYYITTGKKHTVYR